MNWVERVVGPGNVSISAHFSNTVTMTPRSFVTSSKKDLNRVTNASLFRSLAQYSRTSSRSTLSEDSSCSSCVHLRPLSQFTLRRSRFRDLCGFFRCVVPESAFVSVPVSVDVNLLREPRRQKDSARGIMKITEPSCFFLAPGNFSRASRIESVPPFISGIRLGFFL